MLMDIDNHVVNELDAFALEQILHDMRSAEGYVTTQAPVTIHDPVAGQS